MTYIRRVHTQAGPTESRGSRSRVAIQERRRLFRDGLTMCLEAEPDLTVVAAAEDAAQLLRECEQRSPDVAVIELDVREWDVCRLATELTRPHRAIRIVGLYSSLSETEASRARDAGVRTLVARRDGMGALLDAIRSEHARSSTLALFEMETAAYTGKALLTDRELEVLGLVARGYATLEVSVRLAISRKTVENHKQRIFAKLGVQNQAHAVSVAMRRGLLAPVPDSEFAPA